MKHGHYFKEWFGKLDVYRVLDIFKVTDPCLQHAIKKLLCTGKRGHKDYRKDIEDVIDTLQRKLEMLDEDSAQENLTPEAVYGMSQKDYESIVMAFKSRT